MQQSWDSLQEINDIAGGTRLAKILPSARLALTITGWESLLSYSVGCLKQPGSGRSP